MNALILLSDWQKSQIEFWRPIEGFPGYDVSSFGRVRSYRVTVANTGHGREGRGFRCEISETPHDLYPSCDSSGYPYLNAQGGTLRCPKVHRLVALTFIPNPENKPEVNHKNGIKNDCRQDNLEWATKLENIHHAVAAGLKDYKKFYGETHYNSKISDERILEMQKLYDRGIRPPRLAVMFNVTLANVYDLAKGARGRGKTLREKSHARR